MKTWYMTERYTEVIKAVEVSKSTSSRVWYSVDYWGDGRLRAECSNKQSEHKQFHETFDEAKQFLIDRETSAWEWHKAQAHRHQSALGNIRKLSCPATGSTTEQSPITEVTAK